MLTKEQILESVKSGKKSECLDGRDFGRLTTFFPISDWETLGFKPKDDKVEHAPKKWTEKNILAQLKEDLGFAFEKALGRRGISSSFMYKVIKMWMWVLEDDLQHHLSYAMYGLPLYKAVAVKYGFENPIGNDSGSEDKYSEY